MLYQHQQDGAAWLALRAKAILGDTPGLGKTRTLLAALKATGAKLPMVITTASALTHWEREAAVLGMRVEVYSWQLLVYHGFAMMKQLLLRRVPPDSLVVDEFHYAKNADAQRTQLVLGKDGYARRFERVYLASGTPIKKTPFDFWTTLSSCFPEVALEHGLKTSRDFANRFCVSYWDNARHELRFAPKLINEEEFKIILGKIMLRRKPSDIGMDVPAIWWQTVELDGAALDAETEFALADAAGQQLSEDMAWKYKLARHAVGDAKAPAVVQWLLEELRESNEKIVVFAYHRSVLNTLRDGLAALGVCYIDGDVSAARRAQEIDWFQTNPAKRVFLGQILACQEAITLTAASRVVIVEPSWTGVDNVQAAHRVARLGQAAEHCIAQLVSLAGTADERLIYNHKREVEMCEAALNGAPAGTEVQKVRAG